ncbi:MAG: Probable low-affinity inorganic phosphate transporter, partial [uncultured Solirubrobacteraceae bacterium]
RHGDRPRDLRRRLAHHQDDGHPDHQDGCRAGLLRAGVRRRGDLLGLGGRLPAVDHARHLRGDHGGGRRQAGLRRPLGRRGQHPARVGADAAGRRRRRRDHLRDGRSARRRRGRSGRRVACSGRRADRGVRAAGAPQPPGGHAGGRRM